MHRSFILAAAILILAFGVLTDARPTVYGNAPQYRPDNPQNPTRMGDRRSFVGQLSLELVRQAEYLSESSYAYFMGWSGSVSDAEQAVLFKCEEFAAASRLFHKLLQEQTGYFGPAAMRTNLYGASRYLALSFRELEQKMRLGGFQDDFNRMRRDGRRFERNPTRHGAAPGGRFGLAECRRILDRIESEFASWR